MNRFVPPEPVISSYETVLVGRNGNRHHDVTITYTLYRTGRGGK